MRSRSVSFRQCFVASVQEVTGEQLSANKTLLLWKNWEERKRLSQLAQLAIVRIVLLCELQTKITYQHELLCIFMVDGFDVQLAPCTFACKQDMLCKLAVG